MSVRVLLPAALGEVTGETRHVDLDLPPSATVGDVLGALDDRFPRIRTRLRDETGQLRRFVNVYVDGEDIRDGAGLGTTVGADSVVHVLPSVAGG